MTMESRTKGVLTFLLISFGLNWGAVAIATFALGQSLGDPLVQLMWAVPMAFAPAIAAVVVRRWVTREGFRDAGLRPRVRAAGRYYLLAWVGPVLVLAATVGLAAALGLYRPGFSPQQVVADLGLGPVGLLLVLVAPLVALPVFWGEEFGWRGYLQQRIGRSPLRAAVITGLIWSAWHYPLLLTDYTDYPNPLLGTLTWTLLIVAQAIILAWLFLRSGTVWVPCLAHAGNNLVIGTLGGPLLVDVAGLAPSTSDLLVLAPLAVLCGWIVLGGHLQPTRNTATSGRTHAA